MPIPDLEANVGLCTRIVYKNIQSLNVNLFKVEYSKTVLPFSVFFTELDY